LAAPRAAGAEPVPAAPKRARGTPGTAPAIAWITGGLLSAGMLAWCMVDARGSQAAKMAQGWNRNALALTGPARPDALRQAIAWTRRATALDPWSDLVWRDRAEAAHVGSLAAPSFEASIQEAEQAADRAIALAPLRAENHQSLGNLLLTRAQLGDEAARVAGEAAFDQAV